MAQGPDAFWARLCRPLITTVQSGGKFLGRQHGRVLAPQDLSARRFPGNHIRQCPSLCPDLGRLDGLYSRRVYSTIIDRRDVIHTRRRRIQFQIHQRIVKGYVFSNGGGLAELMAKLAAEYEPALIQDKETDWERSRLSAFEKELGYTLS